MKPRRLLVGLASTIMLAGLAGLALPAAASAATAKPAATASPEYIALEVAKVPGAFHVVARAGSTSTAAVNSAHAACTSYLGAAGALFSPQDCNAYGWVRYGYIAYSVAGPDVTTANGYGWSYGWGHTKAIAIDNAQESCAQINSGDACPDGGYAVTPGYAGVQATTGDATSDPLTNAVNWELAHPSVNPANGQNWNNWCEQAVEQAYGVPPNTVPPGYPTAYADYKAQKDASPTRIYTNVDAPRGALVFFTGDSPKYHVGLAYGNGADYYTTDGGTIHEAPLSEGATDGMKGYLGWSYAPSDW